MEQPFVYGKIAEGELFTDREFETQRLRMNFEHGINSVLISPRRMGKTSLVKRVAQMVDSDKIRIVYMDIYKCRTAYDFYEMFASAVLKATASRVELVAQAAREFISAVTPTIHFSPEPNSDFSLTLGLNERQHQPEEILELPERIARKRGIRIVVCIDEFQQIGEFPDSLTVQKQMRSVWQHQQLTSYCFFGSKKHLMSNLFYSRSMPFYQFGDMLFLGTIPTEKWVPFLIARFAAMGKTLHEKQAEHICQLVDCYSAYVQQLAWNVLAQTVDSEVTDADVNRGLSFTMAQVEPLFIEKTARLSTYQLNLLRAISNGHYNNFGHKGVAERFPTGTRANLTKILSALTERELIDQTAQGWVMADPLFAQWFRKNMD